MTSKAEKKAHAGKSDAEKSIKVTLLKSVYGQLSSIRGSVKGLGLRRIGHSVVVADTPSNRGMVNAASHMLKVESALGSGKV
jgi:large subunit ribosomal protein L30